MTPQPIAGLVPSTSVAVALVQVAPVIPVVALLHAVVQVTEGVPAVASPAMAGPSPTSMLVVNVQDPGDAQLELPGHVAPHEPQSVDVLRSTHVPEHAAFGLAPLPQMSSRSSDLLWCRFALSVNVASTVSALSPTNVIGRAVLIAAHVSVIV